jgi:peptidase M50B-like protein
MGTATSFSESVSDALLRVIGTVSCLYAPWDIASDLLLRDVAASDAHTIAGITHVPAVVWGVVWFLLATAGAVYTLVVTSRWRTG